MPACKQLLLVLCSGHVTQQSLSSQTIGKNVTACLRLQRGLGIRQRLRLRLNTSRGGLPRLTAWAYRSNTHTHNMVVQNREKRTLN